MRALVTGMALAIAVAATALAYEDRSVSGDLDADGQAERARTAPVPDPAVPEFQQTEIRVSDTCPSGPVDVKVAGPQDTLEKLRLVSADTRRGREVYTVLRSGAAGRGGEAHVVAWRPTGGEPCVAQRQLFEYRTDRATRRPRGTTGVAGFGVAVRNLTRRYPGREIALFESFTRPREPSCCPSVNKTTYLRYNRALDRYQRYGSRVRRGRPNVPPRDSGTNQRTPAPRDPRDHGCGSQSSRGSARVRASCHLVEKSP